jgi:hypothetical protein
MIDYIEEEEEAAKGQWPAVQKASFTTISALTRLTAFKTSSFINYL